MDLGRSNRLVLHRGAPHPTAPAFVTQRRIRHARPNTQIIPATDPAGYRITLSPTARSKAAGAGATANATHPTSPDLSRRRVRKWKEHPSQQSRQAEQQRQPVQQHLQEGEFDSGAWTSMEDMRDYMAGSKEVVIIPNAAVREAIVLWSEGWAQDGDEVYDPFNDPFEFKITAPTKEMQKAFALNLGRWMRQNCNRAREQWTYPPDHSLATAPPRAGDPAQGKERMAG